MKHIMVCVSGWAGTGKDEFAARLTGRWRAVQTGLADPAKRHLADVYGFTEDQLFGPSPFRNAGDPRYPKNVVRQLGMSVDGSEYVLTMEGPLDRVAAIDIARRLKMYDLVESASRRDAEFRVPVTDPRFSLSPREALQVYCEQLNELYLDTWVAKGVSDQRDIVKGNMTYSRMSGPSAPESGQWNPRLSAVTCFADFRHIHECRYVRSRAGDDLTPVLIRIKRPSVPRPPYQHRSETEQTRIRDAAFDFVVDNSGTLQDLRDTADSIMGAVTAPGWSPKAWDDSYVLAPGTESEGYTP